LLSPMAVPMESWVEFHSPLDWMGYYYCANRTVLQVGVFVLGFVGEGGIVPEEGDGNHPADAGGNAPGEGGTASEDGDGDSSAAGPDGNASLAKTPDCFGIISPIPATGELDPYGHGWNVCYGFRVAESMDCAY